MFTNYNRQAMLSNRIMFEVIMIWDSSELPQISMEYGIFDAD